MSFLVSHSHSHCWKKLFEKKTNGRHSLVREMFPKMNWVNSSNPGFFASFLLPLHVQDVSSTFIRLKVRSTTVRLLPLWSDMNKFCSANVRWPTVICSPDQGQCTGFNGYNRDLIRSWLLDTRGIRAWSRVNYEKWKWAWILPRLFSRDLRWENKIVKWIMRTTYFVRRYWICLILRKPCWYRNWLTQFAAIRGTLLCRREPWKHVFDSFMRQWFDASSREMLCSANCYSSGLWFELLRVASQS